MFRIEVLSCRLEQKRNTVLGCKLYRFLTDYEYLPLIRFVGIKPISTFSTDDVASKVSPQKRQCQVEGERKLKFFPMYSRSACTVECATIKMQESCQCRPYFFRGLFYNLYSLFGFSCKM